MQFLCKYYRISKANWTSNNSTSIHIPPADFNNWIFTVTLQLGKCSERLSKRLQCWSIKWQLYIRCYNFKRSAWCTRLCSRCYCYSYIWKQATLQFLQVTVEGKQAHHASFCSNRQLHAYPLLSFLPSYLPSFLPSFLPFLTVYPNFLFSFPPRLRDMYWYNIDTQLIQYRYNINTISCPKYTKCT